jgi:hypothetical protein
MGMFEVATFAARIVGVPAVAIRLVGAGEQRRWHLDAERLRSLEVEDRFVLGRRLHGQIGRLLALQDAVDVAGRAPILVDDIRPIGGQAADGDEGAFEVDRGQFVLGRQRDDQVAMNERQRARGHDQTAIRGAREGRDGALDLAGVAHDRNYFHAERRRYGLDCGELADPGSHGGIPNDCRSRHARRNLLEQLQPFSAQAVFEQKEAGGVATRARQAVDEAGADRIGNGESEKNLGRVLQRLKPANVTVGTKVRLPSRDFGGIADAVARSLEGSLVRLRLERVDIFHLHNAIIKTGGGEALSVM